MMNKFLCFIGMHKWILWWDRKDGDLLTGRSCKWCPKKQWSRETYVRQYYKRFGDVPMSYRQLQSLREWGDA